MSNSDGFVYMEKYGISVRPDGAVKTAGKGVHFGATNGTGYQYVFAGGKTRRIHRLVMEAFVGFSDLEVNHKNGIRADNRLGNLEYCTRSYNQRDRHLRGGAQGVTQYRNGKWQAQIKSNNRNIHLGYFKDREDACQVYADAARAFLPEGAALATYRGKA